jgi:hypothetical protein
MSLFSKLAFWKKEDDFNFDQAIAQDMNQPSAFPPDFNAQDNPFPGDSEINPAPTQTPSASPQQYAQASRASLYPGSSVSIANPSSGRRELDKLEKDPPMGQVTTLKLLRTKDL